jgi:hypothetical protein
MTTEERVLLVVNVARVCHEANRAYCKTLGDTSQSSWENAPQWQKDSAMDGVQFHLDNPDADDAASHENWLMDKRSCGWVYGPTKDAENKTHPCMMKFQDLPETQQLKDRLFRSICRALS